MRTFTKPSSSRIHVRRLVNKGKGLFAAVLMSILSTGAIAQSFTWSDSFVPGVTPSLEQCSKWNSFISGLAGHEFTSVRVSGTYDQTGITITDPAAATELARLLSFASSTTQTGTIGTVVFEGRTWTVSKCLTPVCGVGTGVALGIDGTLCSCTPAGTTGYAIRPYNRNWGGINTGTCSTSLAQEMTVEFKTGVSIIPLGSTTFCEGEELVLTASSQTCKEPYRYLWSTGETTSSIKVSTTGNYSVQVWGANECTGIADAISVTVKPSSIDAGKDATFCTSPVQLGPEGSSEENVSTTCLFDAEGGNCSFTENICDDKYEVVRSKAYTGTISVPNQAALRLNLYYSACTTLSTFTFKLNGQEFGTFDETVRTCSCTPIEAAGPYPRTLDFAFDQFDEYWRLGENEITIEVFSDGDVYMGGIVAEISPSGFYSWSPVAGLSDATIRNPLASPASATTYTLTYAGPNGCVATDEVRVDVGCGLAVTCQPVTKTLADNCTADVAASELFVSATGASAGALTFAVSPAGPYPVGTTPVTLTVTDANGKSGTCQTTVTVIDATKPTVQLPLPVTQPTTPGLCTSVVTLVPPIALDNCAVTVTNDHPDPIFPLGPTTVTWTATDASGNVQTVTQLVTVTNAAPLLSSVVGPLTPVAVGANAVLGVTYLDDNFSHATIEWGDGSTPTVLNTPALSFEASHAYASAGTYAVNIALTDNCGGVTSTVYESITVFDPRGGSVNGGGWFDSPAGAYRPDAGAVGRGNFEFDASYNGFSNIPQGFATFTFKEGNLRFKSTRFHLLLIDGETARLTGTGTVNGRSGYDLLISMVDDDTKLPRDKKTKKRLKADRIRVKISDASGVVIYDTQFGAADETLASTNINAGSIEVNGSEFTTFEEEVMAFSFGEESTSVYPNPFVDYINVQFATESTEDLSMYIMDIAGRVIATATYPVSADGSYTMDVPETANAGIYLLTIRQGSRIEVLTVVKN